MTDPLDSDERRSAIDDVLNQFLAEGASGDWFAKCEDACLEIARLREIEASAKLAVEASEKHWNDKDSTWMTNVNEAIVRLKGSLEHERAG